MLCLSFPSGEVGFPYDGVGGAFPSGGFTMGGANAWGIDGGVAREDGVPWFIIVEIFCSLWPGKVAVFWGTEGAELREGEGVVLKDGEEDIFTEVEGAELREVGEFCGAEITSNCGIAVADPGTEGAALWFHEGTKFCGVATAICGAEFTVFCCDTAGILTGAENTGWVIPLTDGVCVADVFQITGGGFPVGTVWGFMGNEVVFSILDK